MFNFNMTLSFEKKLSWPFTKSHIFLVVTGNCFLLSLKVFKEIKKIRLWYSGEAFIHRYSWRYLLTKKQNTRKISALDILLK